MNKQLAILSIVLNFSISVSVLASDRLAEFASEQQDKVLADLDEGSVSSAAVSNRQKIEFSAGTENESLGLEIGKKSGSSTWSLKLSAPVNSIDEKPLLPSLSNLSQAISGELSIKKILGRPGMFTGVDSLKEARNEICEKAARIKGLTTPEQYQGDLCTDDASDNSPQLFLAAESDLYSLGLSREEAQSQLLELERDYDCIHWVGVGQSNCKKTITIFEVSATAGSEEFNFLDPISFAKRSQSESVHALGVNLTFLQIPSKWVLRVGYKHEDSFKQADQQTVCSNPDLPVSICTVGSVGEPKQNEADIASLEVRRVFTNFGVSPKISYDLDAEVLGVELPFFIVRDEDGVFSGGFSLGWRDDNQDLVATAFFGRTFNLLD